MGGDTIIRFIVYTALFCLIILTAYQYHERKIAGKVVSESEEVAIPAAAPEEPVRGPAGEKQANALAEASPAPVPDLGRAAVPQVAPTPDTQSETRRRAVLLFNRKDYYGALKLFRQIREPGIEVLLGMGICYYKVGDYRRSVSFLKKVLDRDENNFTALKVIAFAYYRLDDIEESFVNARKGLSVGKDPELESLLSRVGRERRARRGYTEEDSSHFRILFDGYEHGSVEREILDILEDAYRNIGQDLDYFPPEPVTVILYTDRDFHDTTRAPHWSGGLYDGKIRLPVKGMDFRKPLVRKVLFHEYAHAVVHYLAHSCPQWINEGIAEYFSTSYPDVVGQVIPLRNLEKSFSGLNDRNAAIAYRESYSAVSFLAGRYGLYRMKALLEGFGAGKGADAAFEDAFGITYSEFVSGWGKGGNSSF